MQRNFRESDYFDGAHASDPRRARRGRPYDELTLYQDAPVADAFRTEFVNPMAPFNEIMAQHSGMMSGMMNGMMGFGGFGGFGGLPGQGMPGMMALSMDGGDNRQFQSQVYVMKSEIGPDGRRRMEKYENTTRANPERGMREVQSQYSNDLTGREVRGLEREISGRGRRVVEDRNLFTGHHTQRDTLRGMQQEETAEFDQTWQREQAHLPTTQPRRNILTYGGREYVNALPAPLPTPRPAVSNHHHQHHRSHQQHHQQRMEDQNLYYAGSGGRRVQGSTRRRH